MATVVEVLDMVDGAEFRRVRTVFPRQATDVPRHGTVWSHALSLRLNEGGGGWWWEWHIVQYDAEKGLDILALIVVVVLKGEHRVRFFFRGKRE